MVCPPPESRPPFETPGRRCAYDGEPGGVRGGGTLVRRSLRAHGNAAATLPRRSHGGDRVGGRKGEWKRVEEDDGGHRRRRAGEQARQGEIARRRRVDRGRPRPGARSAFLSATAPLILVVDDDEDERRRRAQ